MPVVSASPDPDSLTLTVVGEYTVPVARLWEAWADPRQLEQFWGPPTWPATFTRHDMEVGGRSEYVMTGPEGQKSHGYWKFVEVNPTTAFEVTDGFSNEAGEPVDKMPSCTMRMTFEATATGSRFTGVTTFPTVEAMETLVKMGMVEGMRAALGQLDGVLHD